MTKLKISFDKMKYTLLHRVAASVTVSLITLLHATASYATAAPARIITGKNLVTNITTSASRFPDLISALAYTGGIGLGVLAIYKLKQHGDNPHVTPLKDGLIRLAAGGALLVLPFITATMQGNISQGTHTFISINGSGGGMGPPTAFSDAATASTDVCYWHPSYCGM